MRTRALVALALVVGGSLVGASALAQTPQTPGEASQRETSGVEIMGGVGGGAYLFRIHAGDEAQVVPFREVGVTAHLHRRGPWSFGLQASVRRDLADAAGDDAPAPSVGALTIGPMPGSSGSGGSGSEPPDQEVHAGSRWRLGPYAQYEWSAIRTKIGFVAGNYYNPLESERGGVFIYPQASVRMGSREYGIELGLLDSPALAASANGGLGVLAMRVGMALLPGHDFLFGIGAPYQGPGSEGRFGGRTDDGGYLSYAYQAHLSKALSIDLGGYTGTQTTGVYVTVGTVLH